MFPGSYILGTMLLFVVKGIILLNKKKLPRWPHDAWGGAIMIWAIVGLLVFLGSLEL